MKPILVLFLSVLLGSPIAAHADNSATRDGLVKLPGPGGTVNRDETQVSVQENKGALQFQIALPPLPQRGQLKGGLSLSYNQFQGQEGSALGAGWAIRTPSIEINEDRGTALRGRRADGNFFSNLSMNGERLVFLRKNSDGSVEFALEKSSEPVRIIYRDSPFEILTLNRFSSIDSFIFEHSFEVRYPDGTREIFSGNSEDAEGDFAHNPIFISRWPLRLQLKPVGPSSFDAIEYRYIQQDGRSYLKTMLFAGGASRYEFDTMIKPQDLAQVATFRNSFRQADSLLYTRVRAMFEDQVRQQWCFAYQVYNTETHAFRIETHESCRNYAYDSLRSHINTKSLAQGTQLRAVYRFAGSESTLKADSVRENDIIFSYSDWNEDDRLMPDGTTKASERPLLYDVALNREVIDSLDHHLFTLADYNQDSMVDLVYNGMQGTKVLLGTGDLSTSFQDAVDWTLSDLPLGPQFAQGDFHFADFNGDSFVDIARFQASDRKTISLYLGDGHGRYKLQPRTFVIADVLSGQTATAEDLAQRRGEFIDINLDGTTDYVSSFQKNGATQILLCYSRNRGTMEDPDIRFTCRSSRAPIQNTDKLFGDTDVRLADVNGDGLPDLVQFLDHTSSKGYCAYLNNGNLYSLDPNFTLFGTHVDANCEVGGLFQSLDGLAAEEKLNNLWVVDVNGDGINDIVKVNGSNLSELKVWLGLGDGHTARHARKLHLRGQITLGQNQNQQVKIADIDADGQKEILLLGQGDSHPVRVIDFNRAAEEQLPKSNLLTTIAYESGLRYDFRYSTSADEFIRDRTAHQDNDLDEMPRSLHYPAVVLKQMTVSEGGSGEIHDKVEVTEYIYHDPYYNSEDRRFQGFAAVESIHYGDSQATEGTALTRSLYYSGLRGDERHLAGHLKEQFVYEFTPHNEYQKTLKDTEHLDATQALLHSLSTYARTQSLPCGDFNRGVDSRYCRQLSRSFHEIKVVPTENAGSFLIRDVADWQEKFSETAADTQQCVPGSALGSTLTLKRSRRTEFMEDGSNLPREILITEEGADAPFDVRLPSRTHRTVYTYWPPLDKLGISNLMESQEQYSWKEGDASELLTQRVENTYDESNGWLRTIRTVTPSSLKEVPAQLEGIWQTEREFTTRYKYDAYGNIRTRDRGHGQLERVEYSEDGVYAKELYDARNEKTSLEYNEQGYIERFTDPRGHVAELQYDGLGRIIRYASNQGQLEEYRYKLATAAQPALTLSRERVKRRLDGPLEWAYKLHAFDSMGREIASFDENEYGTSADDKQVGVRVIALKDYNRNGSVTAEYTSFQTAIPSIEDLFQQGFGRGGQGLTPVASLPGNELARTTFVYDHLGRIKSTRSPVGTEIKNAYFVWGEAVLSNYRASRKSTVQKTSCEIKVARGAEVFARVDALGHVHRFDWSSLGQLQSIVLAGESKARTTLHDASGVLEYQHIPGIRSEYHVYDGLGRKTDTLIFDRDGTFQHSQKTEYDLDSRPLRITIDGKESIRYQYDAYSEDEMAAVRAIAVDAILDPKGLLTKVTKKDLNELYDYELFLVYDQAGQVLGRRVTVTDLKASAAADKVKVFIETYQYGPDGKLLYKDDPFGVSSRLRLTSNQMMAGVDLRLPWAADTWEPIIRDMRYNPKGQIEAIDYRKDLQTRIGYEPSTMLMNEVKSYRAGRLELQDLSLDFDGLGNIVEINDNLPSAFWGRLNRSALFQYNARQELIEAQYTKMDAEHGYDIAVPAAYSYRYTPAGSMTFNSELSSKTWKVSDPALSAETGLIPLGPEDHPLTYDSLGQLISNGKLLDATYDGSGLMRCAQTQQSLIYFGYTHDNRRLYKKVLPRTGTQNCRQPSIADAGQLSLFPLADVTIEPSGKQSFVFAGNNRLARVEHAATTDRKGNWFFYLKDHLQSSDVIIAADGTPVEQMAYKPYGDELDPGHSSKWQQHVSTVAKEKAPQERTHHRFTGQYLDDDTGLYYAGARYYDARTGRFTTPDPLYVSSPELCLGNTISCNLYAYAANNPMSKIDPTGLAEQSWWERGISYVPVLGSAVDAVKSGYQAYQDIKRGDYKAALINGGVALLNASSAVMEAGSLGTGSVLKTVAKETFKHAAGDMAQHGLAALGEKMGGEKGRMLASAAPMAFGVMKGGGGGSARSGIVDNFKKTGKASELPLVKKGTKEWDQAVDKLRTMDKGKADIRTATASDAKDMLKEARGNMDRRKQYTAEKYKKGFEVHNQQNQRELDVGNDLQHLKWKDEKSAGHIYYDKPN